MSITQDYDYQSPNYAGFVVIGAGLPRTGTSSLREALGLILNGACYHMASVFQSKASDPDVSFWNKALTKNPRKIEWVNFFEGRGYRAGVDYPASKFYKEIMNAYPDAKVILSVRDPVKWYNSVKNTIYQSKTLGQDPLVKLFCKVIGLWNSWDCALHVSKELFEAIEEGEEASVHFYNQWVEEVKRTVPKERLLVFEAKDGWQPLCDFLDVPIPEGPFPHLNDTATLSKNFRRLKLQSRIMFFSLPVLLVVARALLYTTNALEYFWKS